MNSDRAFKGAGPCPTARRWAKKPYSQLHLATAAAYVATMDLEAPHKLKDMVRKPHLSQGITKKTTPFLGTFAWAPYLDKKDCK